MKYIKRACEEILKRKFDTAKSVAITGARQTGKTTMTTHLFPNIKRVNMRNDMLYTSAKDDPILFLESLGIPLFVDEIQRLPDLINACKVVLDEKGGKGNYLFSGSQKWQLMKGLSESLAGMVSILELPTLCMREIIGIDFNNYFVPNDLYLESRGRCLKKYKNIFKYIHNGFYPELYGDNAPSWEDYYQSYVQTYIERDVFDILKIKDRNTFYRFMSAVAARTGNILDYTNISNDIGVSIETIRTWISVLEMSGIVFLLEPYYDSHLKRSLKTPKIYFKDTGLASYLTSWLSPETLERGAMSGAFFETFVVNEIIKSYANCGIDYQKRVFYYRGKDKINKKNLALEAEIDLIIEENNTIFPIEIKKNSNPSKNDALAFNVIDKIDTKIRGNGVIICRTPEKLKLASNLFALPIEYI